MPGTPMGTPALLEMKAASSSVVELIAKAQAESVNLV